MKAFKIKKIYSMLREVKKMRPKIYTIIASIKWFTGCDRRDSQIGQ